MRDRKTEEYLRSTFDGDWVIEPDQYSEYGIEPEKKKSKDLTYILAIGLFIQLPITYLAFLCLGLI